MDNILISCAGGPAAVGAIKSLKDINFKGKIITIDCDPLSVGGFLGDQNYVVPLSTDKSYWGAVLKIIKSENINIIIPTGDSDIKHFAQNKNILESSGVKVFMSDYKDIIRCQDKFIFFKDCFENFPIPFTSTNYKDLKFPMFAKPKQGSGSRGAKLCYKVSDIRTLDKEKSIHRSSEYIFQEFLPGREYTVDVFCGLDSIPYNVVIRERLQVKAGISSKGKIIINPFIERICKELCVYLNLKGPICIQLKEDKYGSPKIIEVNPRLGGGTYFSTLSGVNFLDLILKYCKGESIPNIKPKEITVLRYYNEIIA